VKTWFQAFAFKWVNLCRYVLGGLMEWLGAVGLGYGVRLALFTTFSNKALSRYA
jgi:hypothetical protein